MAQVTAMRQIAAIRTNKWTDEEERLVAALRPAFGDDLAVVFHNRPAGVAPPLPVIDIGEDWVVREGLALVPDWGWRCGDYFYYALRQARPAHDHYWLIEPDVFFTSDPSELFAGFATASEDVLGFRLGRFAEKNRFTHGLPGMDHHRAIFALTRFSGRALDRLFAQRRAMAARPVSVRGYPNDEIFAFSHAAADPELVLGRLEDRAAGWFEDAQFASDPDLLFDAVARACPPGKVLHPVRGRAYFKQALGRRLVANTGILMRMREAIDTLDADEIEEIANVAVGHVRDAIAALQKQRAARRRRRARLT